MTGILGYESVHGGGCKHVREGRTHVAMDMTARPMAAASRIKPASCSRIGMRILNVSARAQPLMQKSERRLERRER